MGAKRMNEAMQNSPLRATIPDSTSFVAEPPGVSGPLRIDVACAPVLPGTTAAGPLATLYVLDGNLLFPAAATISRLLQLAGEVQPHRLVGVGYDGEPDILTWTRRRLFDFTPTPIAVPVPQVADAVTGGGEAFYAALIEHVIPAVEQRYESDPSRRYLFGASTGGFFAAHVLLTQQRNHFAGIGILSGAFLLGERQLLKRLLELTPAELPQATRIFAAVGSLENGPPFETANLLGDSQALIESMRAKGFDFEGMVLEGETHHSVFFPALPRALRFFLPPR